MNQTDTLHLSSRESKLRKSFKLAISSLLMSCSKEEFYEVFSTFSSVEQEILHQLFTQIITSLHGNIEEEFDSICHENQVGTVLDTVEQLVEEQSLDILFAEKTNIAGVKEELSRVKKDEIIYLKKILEKAEEQNCLLRARLESLKQETEDLSATADAVEKLKSSNLEYGQITEKQQVP